MRLALTLVAGMAAAASLGVSAPRAQEPAPPALAGPYYLISITNDALIFAAGGTVQKSGNFATVTVITGSSPATLADTGFARLDMSYRFDCRAGTYKTPLFAAYDTDGNFVGAVNDDNEAWEAVNPTAAAGVVMALACDGTVPENSDLSGTPQGIVSDYRDFISQQ